jgi:glycosyltransferase involved in cell wall biosynthesis
MNPPIVSVIIPCRNEEKFIGKCLDSMINQDYPKENFEVLVVDGMSEDKTREIIQEYSQRYPFIKLLDNPQKYTPFALNVGIKNSKGEILIRADAHADYEKDYISKCIHYLKTFNADNVGGVLKTVPKENTLVAKAIAYCLSSFLGAGGSWFRTGTKKPRWVDTVFGGCYRREIFEKIGLFNENLLRSQDIELNNRLRKTGGKILLAPEIKAYYYPSVTILDFLKHNFSDGFWVTYPLKFGIKVFSKRHLIPLVFISTLIILWFLSVFSTFFSFLLFLIIFCYILSIIFFSLGIFKKERKFNFLWIMPIIFISRHFSYGVGSLWGLVKILIEKWSKEKKKK